MASELRNACVAVKKRAKLPDLYWSLLHIPEDHQNVIELCEALT
jgi:hypothetical protein